MSISWMRWMVLAVMIHLAWGQCEEAFPISGANQFLQMRRMDVTRSTNGENPVVARSYQGYPWEPIPDQDFTPVQLDCVSCPGACVVLDDITVMVEVVEVPPELVNPDTEARWARLMLQSTFGVSKSELGDAVSSYGNDETQWLLDQMALPATMHRSYYRQRVNPRRPTNTDVGPLYEPCEVGARYHRYVLNAWDKDKILYVHNDLTPTLLTLKVDGQIRGEITPPSNLIPSGASLSWPLRFTICSVEEKLNGTVTLREVGTSGACDVETVNPAIYITDCADNVKNIAPSQVQTVPVSGMPGAVVIRSIAVTCPGHTASSFIRLGGEPYRFDPRIKLVGNSLENPLLEELENSQMCPAVVKSFLNENSCVRAPSCNPLTFSAVNMELNEENMRAWYVDDNIYVYEILDLTLEEPYHISPCSGTSRWEYTTSTCSAPTQFNDTITYNTLYNALANSTDPHSFLRDITLTGADCTPYEYTIGAQIQVGTQCFTHVHPDLHNVYDFTYWVQNHDGNESAFEGGRPNPIARWAEQGLTYLQFPWHHPGSRWDQRKVHFTKAGRKGDIVSFPALSTAFQTENMAQRIGALVGRSEEGSDACGSPGEVENDPALGDRYQLVDSDVSNSDRNRLMDDNVSHRWQGKQNVWYNIILNAPDQLRQRVAWGLSQVVPVSVTAFGSPDWTETWTTYYDIFVRNAFGSYRDILREVAFSPLMARYLTFIDSQAYSRSNTYPDENFAREIMQLFSVGLWVLNEDGTPVLDATGKPVETYTNEDILDFARLWTGFDDRSTRGNIELLSARYNAIDPMQIKPDRRDLLPKAKLGSGFLGDRYPNCYQLPAAHWLKRGAKYHYTGESSVEGSIMDAESPTGSGIMGRFTAPLGSALHDVLCDPEATTGRCQFPSEVELEEDLSCHSTECLSQMITTVKLIDPVTNNTRYYTYESVPCAKMTFFDGGMRTQATSLRIQCADPTLPVGMPACCKTTNLGSPLKDLSDQTCLFAGEGMDWDTALSRCQSVGYGLCNTVGSTGFSRTCQSNGDFVWTAQSCELQIQVYPNGRVGLVDAIGADNSYPDFNILKESSNNMFRVRWAGDLYPSVAQGCPTGCTEVTTLVGDSCVCSFQVTDSIVYTDLNALPTRAEIVDNLFQGAVEPSIYGTYTLCSQCVVSEGVQVWFGPSGVLDEQTIFEVAPVLAGGRPYYLLNRLSTVSVGAFEFRNPPRFMPGAGELTYRWSEWRPSSLLIPAAIHEVEDALDHLFEHPSTGPFVAYRLIQRLVTSNPSPRYMQSVVEAFRTGSYDGMTFSGQYGDMAATVAAVLLDPEARTPMLEADPTFGVMREPIVKLMQVFHALDFTDIDERETIFTDELYEMIGMEPYTAPTVFGFYLPENRPEGPLNDIGIVSPEAGLAITPNLFGLLNGFMGLVDDGFSPCSYGYTRTYIRCSDAADYAEGHLLYQPDQAMDAQDVVDELDLLLTAKRLSSAFKQHLVTRYEQVRTDSGEQAALKLVQKLILMAPEYHVTNAQKTLSTERPLVEEIPSQDRPYKAIVVVVQGGGADTMNLVVPHSNCATHDLYDEYQSVREGATIAQNELLPISVPSGTQPCDTFGVHPAFPLVKDMYDQGEVAFLANTGALVEPITKEDYFAKPLTKELPPSLFAHNIMTRNTQSLHPQNAAAAGVLGRAVTALRDQAVPWRSELYSVAGAAKILEGGNPDFVSSAGITQFSQYDELRDDIEVMTEFLTQSPMAETYLNLLTSALNRTERMGASYNAMALNVTFPTTQIGRQMAAVAKFIKLRSTFETERDVFVTVAGGFDTHTSFDLDGLFSPIDDALGAFRQEMVHENVWENVTVLTLSEFARTLTSNGAGTDHAWGGNYFLMGGGVRGGRILGHYPEKLTEDGEEHIGRGRLLPTTSWEAVWNGVLTWFGVEETQLETVLPNRPNFSSNQLFTRNDIFN